MISRVYALQCSQSLTVCSALHIAKETQGLCIAQLPLVASRHDTTRHDRLSSPYILAQEKVVSCCVALVGEHSATRSSRRARRTRHLFRGVATAWTGVDMSTLLFPEVVPEIDANPEHKRLHLYTRALLLLRRPPCWNKHRATRTTRHAYRDMTQQVEFVLLTVTI